MVGFEDSERNFVEQRSDTELVVCSERNRDDLVLRWVVSY